MVALGLALVLAGPGQAQGCDPLVGWDGEHQFVRSADCTLHRLTRPEGQTWMTNRRDANYPYRFDADPDVPRDVVNERALTFCKLLGGKTAGLKVRKRGARPTRVLFTCTPKDV
jgi:hypothetical protein